MPTETKRISPAKRWCFTLNNWTEDERGALVSKFQADGLQYIIGQEIGDQGTPHLQGYIESEKRIRPLPRYVVMRGDTKCGHWELAKCDRKTNWKYCAKDGNFETNIPRPVMTYKEAKKILSVPHKEILALPGEVQYEASMHVMFAEELDLMNDEWAETFLNEYDEMMQQRYPDIY